MFDVEKKDSIKTLLLTLWKSENEPATKTESAELGSAVNAYILKIQQDKSVVPSFNTFYEYMRDVYRKEMRLPAQLHGEHRPAAQAVRGLRN